MTLDNASYANADPATGADGRDARVGQQHRQRLHGADTGAEGVVFSEYVRSLWWGHERPVRWRAPRFANTHLGQGPLDRDGAEQLDLAMKAKGSFSSSGRKGSGLAGRPFPDQRAG